MRVKAAPVCRARASSACRLCRGPGTPGKSRSSSGPAGSPCLPSSSRRGAASPSGLLLRYTTGPRAACARSNSGAPGNTGRVNAFCRRTRAAPPCRTPVTMTVSSRSVTVRCRAVSRCQSGAVCAVAPGTSTRTAPAPGGTVQVARPRSSVQVPTASPLSGVQRTGTPASGLGSRDERVRSTFTAALSWGWAGRAVQGSSSATRTSTRPGCGCSSNVSCAALAGAESSARAVRVGVQATRRITRGKIAAPSALVPFHSPGSRTARLTA